MKIRTKILTGLAALLGLLGSSAYAQTWNLAADYQPGVANGVNGAWAYGQVTGPNNAFSPLAWSSTGGAYNNEIGVYGNYPISGAFVYQNTYAGQAYGIEPGQVSLESDLGSAAVQWTAPANGVYDFVIEFGGTLASADGGYGNNFAQDGGVSINGVGVIGGSNLSYGDNNLKLFDILNVPLNAGEAVDAYVLNPGYADGGNTQTSFTVTSVPDATGTMALLSLGVGALEFIRRRK